MKTKLRLHTAPTLLSVAAVLAFTSTGFAGTWAGFRRMDTSVTRVGTNAIVNPNGNTGARANRHGADDPPNHDAGDDRGRHRRRGHSGG